MRSTRVQYTSKPVHDNFIKHAEVFRIATYKVSWPHELHKISGIVERMCKKEAGSVPHTSDQKSVTWACNVCSAKK